LLTSFQVVNNGLRKVKLFGDGQRRLERGGKKYKPDDISRYTKAARSS